MLICIEKRETLEMLITGIEEPEGPGLIRPSKKNGRILQKHCFDGYLLSVVFLMCLMW
jgi:hypothetical protein